MHLINAALSASLVLFAASDWDHVDPHTLTIEWPGGRFETVAATNAKTCNLAREALLSRKWVPVGHERDRPAAANCRRGNSFAPGWDKIKGLDY